MPKATAQLDLDASGLSKGTQEAIAAYNRVVQADRDAKTQLSRGPRGESGDSEGWFEKRLKSERRAHTEALGMFRQLASGASATDILTESAVRLSETFKMGLGVAVGVGALAMFAKSASEAGEKIEELDEKLERLGAGQGSTRYSSMDALQTRLKDLQAFATENQSPNPNRDPGGALGTAYGDVIGGIANNILSPLTGAHSKSWDEIINARSARAEETRKLIEEQRGKIAEKTLDDFGIDTEAQFGSPTKAATERMWAKIREQKGPLLNASSPSFNPAIASALDVVGRQKETAISLDANLRKNEIDRQLELNSLQAEYNGSPSQIAAVNLKWATSNRDMVNLNGNDDQRDAWQLKVDLAQTAKKLAEEEADTQKKSDQDAARALQERIGGHMRLADLIEQQAKTQTQADALDRAGQHDQAQRLRDRANLQHFLEGFDQAYNPGTGRLRGQHERFQEAQREHDAERQRAQVQREYNRTGGLLDPQFNTHGELIGGFDPRLGFRIGGRDNNGPKLSIDPRTGERLHDYPGMNGRPGFRMKEDAYGAEHFDSWFGKDGKPPVSKAADEGAQAQAQASTKAANDAKQPATPNTSDAALAQILQILSSWDR